MGGSEAWGRGDGTGASVVASPAPARSRSPQCRGRGRPLGALMIDNRSRRGHPAQARPDHSSSPCTAASTSDLRSSTATDCSRGLRLFEADEEMKEIGGPSICPIDRQRRRDHRRARLRRADLRSGRCCALWSGSPARWVERALDTRRSRAQAPDRGGRIGTIPVAEEGGGEARSRASRSPHRLAVEMAEKALNTGGGLSGLTTGSNRSTPRPAASTTAT